MPPPALGNGRRCSATENRKPTTGNRGKPLVVVAEGHLHAVDFHHVAVAELVLAGNPFVIDNHLDVRLRGGNKILPIAMVDHRGDLRGEPAFELDRGHVALADNVQFARQHVLRLIGFAGPMTSGKLVVGAATMAPVGA